MRSRTATALAGLVVSLVVSVVAWVYFDTLFLFVFLPLVPFLFARGRGSGNGSDGERTVYECPACGFRTADAEFAYCPRDGTELEARSE